MKVQTCLPRGTPTRPASWEGARDGRCPIPSGCTPTSFLTGLSQSRRRRKPTVLDRIVRYRQTFGQVESERGESVRSRGGTGDPGAAPIMLGHRVLHRFVRTIPAAHGPSIDFRVGFVPSVSTYRPRRPVASMRLALASFCRFPEQDSPFDHIHAFGLGFVSSNSRALHDWVAHAPHQPAGELPDQSPRWRVGLVWWPTWSQCAQHNREALEYGSWFSVASMRFVLASFCRFE
jgi:hypothetical protein